MHFLHTNKSMIEKRELNLVNQHRKASGTSRGIPEEGIINTGGISYVLVIITSKELPLWQNMEVKTAIPRF